MVLEKEIRQYPQIAEKIRIIESISFPIPPLVGSAFLDQEFIQKLQRILLQPDPILQTAMTKAQVYCYTRVTQRDYQTIIQTYDSAIASLEFRIVEY